MLDLQKKWVDLYAVHGATLIQKSIEDNWFLGTERND